MAYTLLDLTTAVQDDLKDPSFSSTRITRYLNYGQLAIFNTHYFKFCETSVSGALTSGAYTFEQQDDHQSTIGAVIVDGSDDTVKVVLDKNNYLLPRDFFARFPDPSVETEGVPSYWTEYGDQVYFSCPVDDTYTFTMRYYRVPTSMSGTTDVPDVPETFRELLELYADYRSEKYRGNHDIAATYKQDYEDGLEAMVMRYGVRNQVAPVTTRSGRTRVS